MTILTNSVLSFSQVANREDLADKIYNISPTETPAIAAFGKNKASAVLHEWPQDSLAAAGTNAQLEGDDPTTSNSFQSGTSPSRVNNRCQISYKTVVVSGTQDAVNKAGRKKDIIYQMMKKNKELRRDQEYIALHNNNTAPATGSSSAARVLRSLIQWYATNTSRGASGANGSSSAAVTDGTQRALTEAMVKSQIQAAWTQGGDIDLILAGPFNKTVISGFTGNNTRMQDTSKGELRTAISVYASDFGTHKVVASRFTRDRDLHLLDTDLVKISSLRPIQTIDLAKTGDAEKGMVLTEWTVEVGQEAGMAVVADLTTS